MSRDPTDRRTRAHGRAALGAMAVAVLALSGCGRANRGAVSRPIVPAPSATTTPGVANLGDPYPAVTLEGEVHLHQGGCWNEAQPGNREGAYRQDYYYAGSPCQGHSWLLDVEIYPSTARARAGADKVSAGHLLCVITDALVVGSSSTPPILRQLVRSLSHGPGAVESR